MLLVTYHSGQNVKVNFQLRKRINAVNRKFSNKLLM